VVKGIDRNQEKKESGGGRENLMEIFFILGVEISAPILIFNYNNETRSNMVKPNMMSSIK
jgi:hypothetical protein